MSNQTSVGRIGSAGQSNQMASTASKPRNVRPPNVIVDGNVASQKCVSCRRLCSSVVFSTVGIGTVLLVYVLCAALVFNSLEGVHHEVTPSSSDPGNVDQLESVRGDGVVLTLGVHEQHQLRAAKELRARTVEKLWKITEELNILYKDNWTALADREMAIFQTELLAAGLANNGEQNGSGGTSPKPPTPAKEGKYSSDLSKGELLPKDPFFAFEEEDSGSSFFDSFLYSLSLITTVGYNSRTPNSAVGKIATMILAILGLPILFIYLTVVGSTLARAFQKLYSLVCCCCIRKRRGICRPPASNNSTLEKSGASSASDQPFSRDHSFSKPTWPTSSGHPALCQDCSLARRRRELRLSEDLNSQSESSVVPVWLCFLLVLCYVSAGASLFCVCHGWSYVDSFFFCFAALGTIGIVENQAAKDETMETGGALFVLMCTCYMLVGFSVLAMCADLVHERWRCAMLNLTIQFGFGSPEKVRRSSWLYDAS